MSGEALSIGSTILGGLMGGKKKKGEKAAENIQGYAALPEPQKALWQNEWTPMVQALFDKEYSAPYMERAHAPRDPGDSSELWKLQQMSDRNGGMYGNFGINPNNQDQPQQPNNGTQGNMQDILDIVKGMQFANNRNSGMFPSRGAQPHFNTNMMGNDDYRVLGQIQRAGPSMYHQTQPQEIGKGVDKSKLDELVLQMMLGARGY